MRHRRENHTQILLRVAERLLAIEQRNVRRRRRRRLRHVFKRQAAARDPLPIRLFGRQRALQFIVVDDASLLQIDQQHLARLQPPLLDDFVFGNVEHAHFRRHHDVIVIGNDIARRPQAVAIECRADLATVGKRHRGRPVPRLHQRRVILVECATVLVHHRITCPRFRNHHHHRVGKRITAHRQQLERIVERCGVRLTFVDQRPELGEIVAEDFRCDRSFAGADPVEVAAERIDFAVVANEAERMREVPGGKRVRRKALVHHGQRRHHRFIVQVEVVLADLVCEQHALVDDRARRKRRHIEFLAVPQMQRLDSMPRALPNHVELPLERVRVHLP